MNSTNTEPQTDRVDALLRILADSERRRILTSLWSAPAESVALEELTQRASDTDRDLEHTRIRLHHRHLPKLEQAGLVTYDSHANTVEYHGDDTLERLLDTLQTTTFASAPGQVTRED